MKKPIPFGKYLLIDRVNVGGMAEVYKAKVAGVEGFEKLVAIKRILPNIAEDDEFITMFIDEAKISVQLTHANIAQIYDLGKINESYFIALEYISGKDFRGIFDRMRKRGELLPIPAVCYMISRACEGLDYAHRKKDAAGRDLNIVHRDVSPQNVLVSFEGEVKMIDFGIAKAANKASRTQAGILKGKFGYMSPEQVRGMPLDRRSDVFAVGVVLYELLTGERLFVGESDFSTLEKVRNVEVVPPSTYNRRISPELERIVFKALAKDVDDRYQWCSDLQDDLQRFLITSDSIFSRKDLSAFMKAAFAEDLEREKIKNQAAMGQDVGDALNELPPEEPPAETEDADSTQLFDATEQFGGAPPPAASPAPPPAARPGPPPPQAPRVGPPPGARPGAPPVMAGRPPGAQPARPGMPPGMQGGRPAPPVAPQVPQHQDLASLLEDDDLDMPTLSEELRGGEVPINLDVGDTLGNDLPLPTPQPVSRRAPKEKAPKPQRPRKEKKAKPRKEPGEGSKAPMFLGLGLLLVALGGGGTWFFVNNPVGGGSTGVLVVKTVPERAAIFIDGQPVSNPFISTTVEAGEYAVRVELEGYETHDQKIAVLPGEKSSVSLELQRAAAATASVLVVSVPLDTQVLVDGEVVKEGGEAPWKSDELTAGVEHTITVRKAGFRDQVFTWTPSPGGDKMFTAQLVAAQARLVVHSEPSRAKVYLDDKYVGRTPVTVDEVDATQPHALQVKRGGCWQDFESTLLFGDEPEKRIDVELEQEEGCGASRRPTKPATTRPRTERPRPAAVTPAAAPEPAGKGKLRLNVIPGWAYVSVDGTDVGVTPLLNHELSAGAHTVVLKTQDGRTKTVKVQIKADQVTTEKVRMD